MILLAIFALIAWVALGTFILTKKEITKFDYSCVLFIALMGLLCNLLRLINK